MRNIFLLPIFFAASLFSTIMSITFSGAEYEFSMVYASIAGFFAFFFMFLFTLLSFGPITLAKVKGL